MCVALGVWWHKNTPGKRNINAVTSQVLTDFGNGPTFYDCLVEVSAMKVSAMEVSATEVSAMEAGA